MHILRRAGTGFSFQSLPRSLRSPDFPQCRCAWAPWMCRAELPSFPRDDAHDLHGHGRGHGRSSNRRHRRDDGAHAPLPHDGDGRGRSSNRRRHHRGGDDGARAPLPHDGDDHARSIHHDDVRVLPALFQILLIHLTYELPLFIV